MLSDNCLERIKTCLKLIEVHVVVQPRQNVNANFPLEKEIGGRKKRAVGASLSHSARRITFLYVHDNCIDNSFCFVFRPMRPISTDDLVALPAPLPVCYASAQCRVQTRLNG